MGVALDLRETEAESIVPLIEKTDKKIIFGKLNLFNRKEVYEAIKNNEKVSLISTEWKDKEEIDELNKLIDNMLMDNLKFSICVGITNKNYFCLEEIVEYLKEKNAKNIIFQLTDNTNALPKFGDIKDFFIEIINKTEFPIYVENIPLCFLGENKDHVTSLIETGIKPKKCGLCELNSACRGIKKEYLDKYGSDEIKPINKLKEAISKVRKKLNQKSLIYISDDDIFFLLKEFQKSEDFWESINNLGYPIAIGIEIINELEKEKILKTEEYKVHINVKSEENKNKVKDFSRERLESDPTASQLTVEQEDIEKRVNYIIEKCPSGGGIVFLGDDDFISLSTASRNHFEKIVVLEFDEKIADKIRLLSKKEGYDIEVITHDLRKCLPEKLLNKFDVFYTDSPYSMNGFGLFISRGIELLKNEPKKHGFASFSCEMPELEMVELPAQNMINKMKLFMERKETGARNNIPKEIKQNTIAEVNKKLNNFRELSEQERWYLGALARKEYLFHFLTTNQTRPLIKGDFFEELYFTDYALNFYVDEELRKEIKKNTVFNWKNGN